MANKSSNNTGADIGKEHAYSLHHDLHQDFKAGYELANPSCCASDCAGERLRDDKHLAASTCRTLGHIV